MEKWKSLDKNKKILIVGIAISLLLVITIILIIVFDAPRVIMNEPIIIDRNNTILNENIDFRDEDNKSLVDELLYIVNNKQSGLYTIGDRHFIVLTTCGLSSFDIEYNLNTDIGGNLIVNYRISDVSDNEFKLRYKIIEIENANAKVELLSAKENDTTAYTMAIVTGELDNKKVIDINNSRAIQGLEGALVNNGLYAISYNENGITEANKINSVYTNRCTLVSKIEHSSSDYNLRFNDGTELEVKSLDLNPVLGKQYLFELTSESGKIQCKIAGGEELCTDQIEEELIEDGWDDTHIEETIEGQEE